MEQLLSVFGSEALCQSAADFLGEATSFIALGTAPKFTESPSSCYLVSPCITGGGLEWGGGVRAQQSPGSADHRRQLYPHCAPPLFEGRGGTSTPVAVSRLDVGVPGHPACLGSSIWWLGWSSSTGTGSVPKSGADPHHSGVSPQFLHSCLADTVSFNVRIRSLQPRCCLKRDCEADVSRF